MTMPKTNVAFRRPSRERDEAPDISRPRPTGDAPGARACMSCGAVFESEGWHNRLCHHCRKRSMPSA